MDREYYFVVHFQSIKQNKIVPSGWIYEIDQHVEKFLNYGMNSSQRFRCYYTSDPRAFDENGCPKVDWEPDFNLELVQNLDGNELVNGCYVVKLLKCKRTYDSAIGYVNARRNIEPKNYNPNRDHELPIPSLSNAELNEDNMNSESDSSDDAHDSIETPFRNDGDKIIDESSRTDEFVRTNSNEIDAIVAQQPFIFLHRIGNDDTTASQNENTEDKNNCESLGESITTSETTEIVTANDGKVNGDLVTNSQINAAVVTFHENTTSSPTADSEMNAVCAYFNDITIGSLLQIPYMNENTEDNNNCESLGESISTLETTESATANDGKVNGDSVTDSEINAAIATSHENANSNPTADSDMNAVCAIFDENATDPLSQSIEIKTEPMHMVYFENFDRIVNYIEEPEEVVVDDDLIFYVSSNGYAKPIDTLMDGRCKREKFDKFSGMVKCFNTKNGRVYKVGASLMEIPFHLVEILIGWNTSPRNEDLVLDKRFVNSLLMVLVPLKCLAEESAPEPVLMFIREMLLIRSTIQFFNEENVPNEEVLLADLSPNDKLAVEQRLNQIDGYKIQCFEEARLMLKRPMCSAK